MVRSYMVFGIISTDKRPSLAARSRSGTVVIQHIITKGTIDERIVKALSKKEMTQTALIDAVKADLEVV